MRLVTKKKIQSIIDYLSAIQTTECAFAKFSNNKSIIQNQIVFNLPAKSGEICIKTAHDPTLPTYTIKQVSVFPQGETTLCGTMNIYDSTSGKLLAVLAEEGWLTLLRTAAAGVVAEKYLAQKDATTLGMIGAGSLSSMQLEVLLSTTKKYMSVLIWNRTFIRGKKLKDNLQKKYPNIKFISCTSLNEICEVDTLFLTTAATAPIILPSKKPRCRTVISLGSDMSNKCEIDPKLYASADKIYADSIALATKIGQIRQLPKNIPVEEIGTLIQKNTSGRKNTNELIIANLVGLGIQDTYIGNFVYQKLTAT